MEGVSPGTPAGMGVAICGCGGAGRHHARALSAAGAQVRWLIDRDIDRARRVAAEYPAARAGDRLEAALGDPQVRAVSVCLPHAAHVAATVAAAEAGRHVLCEKPLAPSLREADAAIAAAERAGVTLRVVENQAHDPAYWRIADYLRDGVIGDVALAEVHREGDLGSDFVANRPGFLEPGGGILLSGAVHDVGTLRRLLGEVVAVRALAPRKRIAEMMDEDSAVMLLSFAHGAAAVLVESFATRTPETSGGAEIHSIRLAGSGGVIELSGDRVLRLATGDSDTRESFPETDTYRSVVSEFLAAIAAGDTTSRQAHDHRRTLQIVLAAQRSAREGNLGSLM